MVIRRGRDMEYANCFSQEEEIGNARYEKGRMTEKRIYKRGSDGIINVKERMNWEEKKGKLSRGRGIIVKEDVRIMMNLRREGYDEYLESTDD